MATACTHYESPLPYTDRPASSGIVFCSDGRLGDHVERFAQDRLHLTCFDRVAVPGGAACLAGHWTTWRDDTVLRKQLQFLVATHHLGRLTLVAHQDCGHYDQRLGLRGRAMLEQQLIDLRQASQRLRRLNSLLQIEAYYAHHDDGRVMFLPVAV